VIVFQHVDTRVEETLSQLNIVSTIYWCNNEGGIMPSPDEVHQSTVERNAPRWWIAFITGQHGGLATKDQRRIDFITGGTNVPYLNEALISTSPFMAVATWLDWCKLRDIEIPNTLILVSWVEDTLQQRLRLGNRIVNICNRGQPPQLHVQIKKTLRFTARELRTQISWELDFNDDPTTTSQLVATIVSATDGQREDTDERMFDPTAQQLKATASMPTAAGSSQQS